MKENLSWRFNVPNDNVVWMEKVFIFSTFHFFIFLNSVTVFPSCLESKSLGTGHGTESQNIGIGTTFENHNASQTELNNATGWCVKNDIAPSLVIKFNTLITVSKVATQGASYNNETYFASKFQLQFGYDDGKWYEYQKNSEPVVIMFEKLISITVYTLRKYPHQI